MQDTDLTPETTSFDDRSTTSVAVATDAGLRLDGRVELSGRSVSDVAPSPGGLLALCDGRELLRRADGRWATLATIEGGGGHRIGVHGDQVFVGGSEARLWRLVDGALQRVTTFDTAPTHDGWHTPWGGPPDVFSFASDGDRLYVNVHVGGIIRSDDGGSTWTDTIDLHDDVHQVSVADDGTVWAATGMRQLARSHDRGATWEYLREGLHSRYALAVVIGDAGPIASVSSGPFAEDGRVYRWAGDRFERVTGLPDELDGAVGSGRIAVRGDRAALAIPNGDLYTSSDGGVTWTLEAEAVGKVNAVAIVSED